MKGAARPGSVIDGRDAIHRGQRPDSSSLGQPKINGQEKTQA